MPKFGVSAKSSAAARLRIVRMRSNTDHLQSSFTRLGGNCQRRRCARREDGSCEKSRLFEEFASRGRLDCHTRDSRGLKSHFQRYVQPWNNMGSIPHSHLLADKVKRTSPTDSQPPFQGG